MGMDLIYRCDGQEFMHRFSMSDWETLEVVRQLCPEAVATIVDVPDLGDEVLVPLFDLRNAVEQIDSLLHDRPELLPYTYQFKPEYLSSGDPSDDRRIEWGEFGTGGLSGIRLPGDEVHWYAIHGGLNECRLEKIAAQQDGKDSIIVDQRDMRGERELWTANCGRIQIRKRRTKSSLRKGLAEIRDFLAEQPEGKKVTKVVC
jgi:hypothetical protein